MQVAFFSVVLDREWPGCPGIWVGTSRIWKNFMQGNFGLIFVPYLRIPQENPLNLLKSQIFTNTPCKSTCLYNAPSLHTVDLDELSLSRRKNIAVMETSRKVIVVTSGFAANCLVGALIAQESIYISLFDSNPTIVGVFISVS